MADTSKARMNLSAIKKVDPYANDIVDSSSHVAFYTFSSEQNEWEKTDVEGAFFIYSRNAQPYHSIFINNRLNTTSFVEPITGLELQTQPPFLLYRNERARIRGFWFYNSQECERIGQLVAALVQKASLSQAQTDMGTQQQQQPVPVVAPPPPLPPVADALRSTGSPNSVKNVNIFNMLSKAQQEYNDLQTALNSFQIQQKNQAPRNVMQFFAAAKPAANESAPFFQRMLPNTLSVEQLEKQQRTKSPLEDGKHKHSATAAPVNKATPARQQHPQSPLSLITNQQPTTPQQQLTKLINSSHQLNSLTNNNNITPVNRTPATSSNPSANNDREREIEEEKCLRQLFVKESPPPSASKITAMPLAFIEANHHAPTPLTSKPALMPPTMFEKSSAASSDSSNSIFGGRLGQEPLNKSQLVQAFTYLMQNDEEFVHKLHEAYLNQFTKALIGTTYD